MTSDRPAGPPETLEEAFAMRFGDAGRMMPPGMGAEALLAMASHGAQRSFTDEPVAPEVVRTLCACALSAPTKSDLQQRDIIIVSDPAVRRTIDDLLEADWMRRAPVMLVICGNGRRLPQIAEWRDKPFANDHFDLLFNAIGDAAISLGWLQLATNMAGLGGCPISIVRDKADEISRALGLPPRVFPFAGFCLGWPKRPAKISMRLPLSATVHENAFSEEGLRQAVDDYDRRRASAQPFRHQRDCDRFGEAEFYGWSEEKARQYATSMRADFGWYLRDIGYNME